jgi:hypothetical protein
MKSLHALLLALVLPALLLPEGVTLCLKQLVGDALPASCCESCCTHATAQPVASRDANGPSVAPDEHAPCCVTTPATERTLDPTTRKVDHDLLVAVTVVAAPLPAGIAVEPPFAPDVAARSRAAFHPPQVVPITLPLRL